ncbi:tetratricopeptide repeat protein [Paenibacillus polysaccharolyticus]|uniref:Tetratricopeptide repeat protein n=2 Tax=Paenibacillus cucumis (ex Kampfer et al. 2016) TaxID=1776858 RepID=A0ABS7KSN4_9BACL|nr:tetratricopeptide repeat protein [Paenibacillus cucumis (ex Kampfer et al. 2016)]MDP9698204.1 hypothetical protein [Paenibacillus intestini]
MTFYNRVQETRDIVKIMEDKKSWNKIILLYSPSGVGKSGLVQKLFNEEFKDYLSFRVKVSRSSPDTIENLCYINRLYKEISELAKNEAQSIPTPEGHALKNLKGIALFFYNFLRNKVGIENENKLYESSEDIGITRKKDYLIHVLSTQTFFISIENIQNIDTQSIEILSDILKKVSNLKLIFEYTSEIEDYKDVSTSVVRFMEQLDLDKNTSYECYEIKKMDFIEAKKLIPPTALITDLEKVKEIYDNGYGNLQRMKLLTSDIPSENSPIQYSLEKLDSSERYVVNTVYLNEGKIDSTLLVQLLTNEQDQFLLFTQQKVAEILKKLEQKYIISTISNEIEISHDSIILELERQSHNPTLAAAYRLLTNYYNKSRNEMRDNNVATEKLFMLYLKFHDESIIGILKEIKEMIIQQKYPQRILSKLVYLRDKLLDKNNPNIRISDEISLALLEVSYQMELGQFAEESLNIIYNKANPLHRAYYVGLKVLNNNNSETQDEVQQLIQDEVQGSQCRLTMELMLLSSMMETKGLHESKVFAQKMLSVKSYEKYMEYAFLLRNYAELVESTESLKLYNKCLEIFDSFNRKDLQAQIYISIAMCHSYLGELDAAKEDLEMAVELSEGKVKENMILNNYAVIDMLSGNFTEPVLKNLKDALLLTSNPYEKIIVKCNLLVFYTVKKDYTIAHELCREIEQSEFENYKYEEFLHIVYSNLSFYYQEINNPNQLIYSKEISELQSVRAENLNPYVTPNTPYRLDFLGYWNIEVSRDLQH